MSRTNKIYLLRGLALRFVTVTKIRLGIYLKKTTIFFGLDCKEGAFIVIKPCIHYI